MAEEPKNNENIRKNVEIFFNAYNKLSADGKVAFLVSLDKSIKDKTEREKKMFIALLKAARDGKNINEAIEAIGKAERGEG